MADETETTRSRSNTTQNDDHDAVRVAVRIRPQMAREIEAGAETCVTVPDVNVPQVSVDQSDKAFTYDYAYDADLGQKHIYESAVAQLVDGCFHGFNATVLAYGQTGAGKTFTMGTGFQHQRIDFSDDDNTVGLVPRALKHIFQLADSTSRAQVGSSPDKMENLENTVLDVSDSKPTNISDFKMKISFMELYNEQIVDLLSPPATQPLKIQENEHGEMVIPGLSQQDVNTYSKTMEILGRGSTKRTTAATSMNAVSSRSHAIFTLYIECTKNVKTGELDDLGNPIFDQQNVKSKFHFVDLAGSERIKKTGAEGDRKKEGIAINYGLLILGNVISALGDPKRRGTHVPYRDSKLTRILQDSLGGNSRTLMIACVSPSDSEFVETLSTLKYANRARNIKNKIVQNQDSSSKQIKELRERLKNTSIELEEWRNGKRAIGEDGMDSLNDIFEENKMLQKDNESLRKKLNASKYTIEDQKKRLIQMQGEQAMGLLPTNLNYSGDNLGGGDNGENPIGNVINSYLEQIESLQEKMLEAGAENERLNKVLKGQIRGPDYNPVTCRPTTPLDSKNVDFLDLINQTKLQIKQQKSPRKVPNEISRVEAQNLTKSVTSIDAIETSGVEDVNSSDPPSPINDSLAPAALMEDLMEDDEAHINDELDAKLFTNEEIDIMDQEIEQKEKLVSALEDSLKQQDEMKEQYDSQLENLKNKINDLETNKKKEIAKIQSKMKSGKSALKTVEADKEDVKRVTVQYERKIKDYQSQVKGLQAAKKTHEKEQKKAKTVLQNMQKLKNDIVDLKKQKAKRQREASEKEKNFRKKDSNQKKIIQKANQTKTQLEGKMKRMETSLNRKIQVLDQQNRSQKNQLKNLTKQNMSRQTQGRVKKDEKVKQKEFHKKYAQFSEEIASYVDRKKIKMDLSTKLDKLSEERTKLLRDRSKRDKAEFDEDVDMDCALDQTINAAMEENGDNLAEAINYRTRQIKLIQKNIFELDDLDENIAIFDPNNPLLAKFETDDYKSLVLKMYELLIEEADQRVIADHAQQQLSAKYDQLSNMNEQDKNLLNLLTEQAAQDCENFPSSGIVQPIHRSRKSGRRSGRHEDTARPRINSNQHKSDFTTVQKTEFSIKLDRQNSDAKKSLKSQSSSNPSPIFDDSLVDREHTFIIGPSSTSNPPTSLNINSNIHQNAHQTGHHTSTLKRNNSNTTPDQLPVPSNLPTTPVKSLNETFTVTSSEILTETPTITEDLTVASARNVFSRLHHANTPKTKTGVVEKFKKKQFAKNTFKGKKIEKMYTAIGHDRSVQCLKMIDLPNRNWLSSGSKDRSVKVWDMAHFTESHTLAGHPTNINAIEWIQRTNQLASASGHYTHLWDLRSEKCTNMLLSSGAEEVRKTFTPCTHRITNERPVGESDVKALHCFGDNHMLVSAALSVYLWDVRHMRSAIGGLQTIKETTCFSSNSQNIFMGDKFHNIKSYDRSKLEVLIYDDFSTGVEEKIPLINPVHGFKPPHFDAVTGILSNEDSMYTVSKDGNIKMWDLQNKRQHDQKYKIHDGDWVTDMCWLQYGQYERDDSKLICSVGRDRGIKVHRQETLEVIGEVSGAHAEGINAVETSRQMIFSAGDDKVINIWASLI